jgi:hypothetical protein
MANFNTVQQSGQGGSTPEPVFPVSARSDLNLHRPFHEPDKLLSYLMESYPMDDLTITLDKEGAREFSKVSFPIRYGLFSEIQTPEHLFQFNLNGEIKYIQGRSSNWPNPAEWLKRTPVNDWVYYSAGDYKGVFELFGEYYFPCLSYPSNSLTDDDPFQNGAVISAIHSWQSLREKIEGLLKTDIPQGVRRFLNQVVESDEDSLRLRSQKFHRLLGGPIPVLPPDTRHVDYEVIPIIVADGCLYHCGFCRVKSGQDFTPRTSENIVQQIRNLKRFYSQDIHNYNSLFLGQHDALSVGREVLEFTAKTAYETFDFDHSDLKGARLFLFGSADSLIHSAETLFESLNGLPFYTYINVGLESADRTTLTALKKPVAVEKVHEAFSRMLEVNRKYERIEVTANFVYGDDLPPGHLPSFLDLVRKKASHFHNKGTLYLSPLMDTENGRKGKKRELLRKFYKIKAQSPLPTFLYLIQRL